MAAAGKRRALSVHVKTVAGIYYGKVRFLCRVRIDELAALAKTLFLDPLRILLRLGVLRRRPQRLLDIRDKIVHVLHSHAQANQLPIDPQLLPARLRHSRMRHEDGQLRQTLDAAKTFREGEQLERLEEALCRSRLELTRLVRRDDVERDHPSAGEALGAVARVALLLAPHARLDAHLLPCEFPLPLLPARFAGEAVEARVAHVAYEALLDADGVEPAGDGEAVEAVLPRTKAEGLDSSDGEEAVKGGGDGPVGVLEEPEAGEEDGGVGDDGAAETARTPQISRDRKFCNEEDSHVGVSVHVLGKAVNDDWRI